MCVLRAGGKHFDVDGFLERSKLRPCEVHHKGEPKLPRTNPEKHKWPDSGFNVSVSDAPWEDLGRQLRDAARFLGRNKTEMKRLRKYKGVEFLQLDFPTRHDEKRHLQIYFFPNEFIALAGQLGIGLVISEYP
jgi:hypothetical protein